jgi:hypothetical protein
MLTKPFSRFGKEFVRIASDKLSSVKKKINERQTKWRKDVRSGKVGYYDTY